MNARSGRMTDFFTGFPRRLAVEEQEFCILSKYSPAAGWHAVVELAPGIGYFSRYDVD
jgi:hypothetical protein